MIALSMENKELPNQFQFCLPPFPKNCNLRQINQRNHTFSETMQPASLVILTALITAYQLSF